MGTRKLRRPDAEPQERRSSPGRIVFDSRGNPVWEWDTSAGDSTSVLLRQLENDDLALEPTRSFRSPGERARSACRRADAERPRRTASKGEPLELEEHGPGKGFDPYNRS